MADMQNPLVYEIRSWLSAASDFAWLLADNKPSGPYVPRKNQRKERRDKRRGNK